MTKELDREIAEVVMGWAKRPLHGMGWWDYDDLQGWVVRSSIFHPSSSIAASWQVVEKMREQGLEFALESPEEDGDKLWVACFLNHSSLASGRGSTAPEAICKAALAVRTTAPQARQGGEVEK